MGDTLYGVTSVPVGYPIVFYTTAVGAGTYSLQIPSSPTNDSSLTTVTIDADGMFILTNLVPFNNTIYLHDPGGTAIANRVDNWSVVWTAGGSNPYITAAPVLSVTPGDTELELDWTAATLIGVDARAALTYSVRHGTSSPPGTLVTSGLAGLSYTDTGLSNGTLYYERVTADLNVISTGDSVAGASSNIVSATPAVQTLQVSLAGIRIPRN